MLYDVIVVGARCAGAPLAAFLARAGAKVLLLDRDRLPSDHSLSTHELHAPGMDVLDELGVGARVRAVSPCTRVMRIRRGEACLDVEFRPGREEYCPRRHRLDGWLQQAAQEAGAELWDEARVRDLCWTNGRVVGVRLERRGKALEARARWVVGADGRSSRVAACVRAEEYLAYDAPRAMYWSYWPAPEWWSRRGASAYGMFVAFRDGALRLVFQTDDDQLVIGSAPPMADVARWRAAPKAALLADRALDPEIAPLVRNNSPTERIRGIVGHRYFLRRAAGPGWALAGDAGLHKEFVTGDGMTEALVQARTLCQALLQDSDAALERWWRARDVRALPLYFFGQQQGALAPPTALEQALLARAARVPRLRARVADVMDHRLAPSQMLSLFDVLPVLAGRLLRGDVRALGDFMRMGRVGAQVERELRHRRALLRALETPRLRGHAQAEPLPQFEEPVP